MMDTADPLCAISSTTCLLRRTLGGPAPAASPSKADEALLRGISATLKGSKELIEQSKIAMKEYGDIHTIYQDDGGKAVAAANCKNNKLGRRPGGERKRHRFTMKHPTNKALPSVDRSVLDTISDPDEYFAKELELDGAEAALKQLNGEGQPKTTLNFDPVAEPKRRNSSRPRKSYSFSLDAHASSATMIPLSQSENMTEPLTSQDNANTLVSEKIEQSTLSKSDRCAISDSLMEEDSFNEKDKDDEITNIMGSFQEYDGPDKVDFLRKKIGIGEIPMENIYHRDSVLGGLLGGTAGINLLEAHTLEGPLSRSHQARVSELEKHTLRDAAMDNDKDLSKDDGFEGHTQEKPLPGSHQARVSELVERIFRDSAMDSQSDLLKDDEFERPPEIVMREQSLPHDSSDQDLATDEIFSAREKDREAPSSSGQSAENVIDPEPNIPDSAIVDDNPCSRHDISMEEDNMPMDHSTVDESNNEVISSHPLDDASTEVLANTPGRNVASDDIAGTSHSAEDNIQHQEDNMPMDHSTVDETTNEVISSHPLEDASTEVLANTPGRNVASDDIAGTSHSAEDNIQHQEVVEEDGVVQDKSVHSLEIPLEDIGPQNQSQAPDGTIKELAADLRNAPSPTKGKAQKVSKRGKTKQQPKRGKKVPDESGHSLEQLQADFDSENQPHTHDANAEKLIADVRALSPTKEKTQKATQSGKNKQQSKQGKKVADESRHSLEIPQADFDSENQPHTHDANTETLIADVRAVSPTKEKTQKATQRAKNKQQLKRRKKVADESRHSLETPQADCGSENQPHTHDANAEKLVADARAVTPTKEKTQKATRRGKKKQQPKQGKKVADEFCCSLEMPQTDLDTENQPHTHDLNSEQQTVVMRNALSPNKSKGEKAQRRNRAHELNKRKSLADDGLEWQSGVRRSKRTRYRPLEQWRGERVLYGRIHETMVTVIGVKTYSPDKDGKAALKVKSFVPEQYSDIFAKSAKS